MDNHTKENFMDSAVYTELIENNLFLKENDSSYYFINYPYEWSFDMLKDAGLAYLNVLILLFKNNFMVGRISAFDIMYHCGRMKFVNLEKIVQFEHRYPFIDYITQIYQQFIFPLLVTVNTGIEFSLLWRSSLNGISKSDFLNIVGPRCNNSQISSYLSKQEDFLVLSEKKEISQNELIFIMESIQNLIKNIVYKPPENQSHWIDYPNANTYQEIDRDLKKEFVKSSLLASQPKTVVDLGANMGIYTNIAAHYSENVIGLDMMPACVNEMYLTYCKEKGNATIYPVINNLLNPSPAMGWQCMQYKDLFSRINADFFLALALMHHITIPPRISMLELVGTLKNIADSGIIEWVDPAEKMLSDALENCYPPYDGYSWENFVLELEKQFVILNVQSLHMGHRKLCFVGKK